MHLGGRSVRAEAALRRLTIDYLCLLLLAGLVAADYHQVGLSAAGCRFHREV